VLFVSHNMATVTTLCQKAIWLVNGQVNSEGDVEHITSKYLTYGAEHSGEVILTNQSKNQRFCFKKISLVDANRNVSAVFDIREPIKICFEYEIAENIKGLDIGFRVFNSSGIPIFTVERSFHLSSEIYKGTYLAEVEIPALFLAPGCYSINIGAHIPNVEVLCLYESLMSFEIEETGSNMALYKGLAFGLVLVDFRWKELTINRA
ncbi:MAG: Wzt carbohydrate-binding domain-containing protein, partial [Dolichospermum sp.]